MAKPAASANCDLLFIEFFNSIFSKGLNLLIVIFNSVEIYSDKFGILLDPPARLQGSLQNHHDLQHLQVMGHNQLGKLEQSCCRTRSWLCK